MRSYEIITPLKTGGKRIAAGTVELDQKEGDALVAIGALRAASGRQEASSVASSIASQGPLATAGAAQAGSASSAPPAEKPLAKMNKGELTKVATDEGVEIPADATNKAIAALIEAARAAKANS